MNDRQPVLTTHKARLAAAVCAILCLLFGYLSFSAIQKKSATYDEPLHIATGWLNLWRGDFRLSPDVPPLWEYWIALPLGRQSMDFDATPANESLDHRAIAALYQTPGADGVALVDNARWINLPLAQLLAILVAIWAGQLGGPVAAVAAMFVFVFDPNWLGHGPLAKNDVPFALVYFAAAYAAWRVGRRATWPALAGVVILPAICLGTKLSGLIVGPLLVLTLAIRALLPEPWRLTSQSSVLNPQSYKPKLALAATICLAAALLAYAGLWAQYRFRFDAGSNGQQLDIAALTSDLRDAEVRSQWQVDQPTPAQLAAWKPALSTRAVLWLERNRLVPQAWAGGFIYTQSSARERNAYLMGEVYPGARISYFPLAWLFKEPLALIAAAVLSCFAWRWRNWNWAAIALVIPPAVYLLIALLGNVNVGLRHVFPVLPFMDVAIGLAAARAWRAASGRFLVVILACGLAAESLAAYPDFISFFNIACGGERGGFFLLGDSNLDWGQDLPLLADWQKQHPTTPLYLDYFGTCDPAAYNIHYLNVPGGYVYGPPPGPAAKPGVAAISATKLQGLFVIDPAHDFATPFEHAVPMDVLGGTIYLFPYSPR